MNIQEYISSGILELYVLGKLSEQESREVEALAAKHAEVRKELENIFITMEQYATLHAVTPHSQLKGKIFSKITSYENEHRLDAQMKQLTTYKYTAIAASVLALVFMGFTLLYYSRWNHAKQKVITLEADKRMLAQVNTIHQNTLNRNKEMMAMLQDTNTTYIRLKGKGKSSSVYTNLWWNKTTGQLYVGSYLMPEVPEDKWYQLWAIVDGKPQDAGMLCEPKQYELCPMKSFKKASAFAITIENKEGSPTPTLENLVAIHTL
ncbi:MAG: anti-sigma factor [Cytophagaceae bacterium]|nr:anti-sigma factor [Cytophagaceae bacterium]MDW8456845.1 anti-sigma factor [Cytophagaceae bacterium]